MRSLLLVLFLSAVAFAESTTVRLERPVAGRVIQGSGVLCGGTPTLDARLILSAHHVTGGKGNKIECFVRPGYRHIGTVIGADKDIDAALILIRGAHLKDIPNARLYFGNINTDLRTVTEGYPEGVFRRVASRPVAIERSQMLFAGGVKPGSSGGPQYVAGLGRPYYLTITSRSDTRYSSIGPYRTALKDFVETCSSSLGFNGLGEIRMTPRRQLEGPIAVPEPAPPESVADNTKDELSELRKQVIEALNNRKPAEPTTVEPTPATPEPSPVRPTAVSADDEVVTINVPVRLRIRVENQRNIIVEQVK